MKKLLFYIVLFSLLPSGAFAQDLRVNMNLKDANLSDLAAALRNNDIQLFYRPENIQDVNISIQGVSISLDSLLYSALKQKNLGFFRNNQRQVFILDQEKTVDSRGFNIDPSRSENPPNRANDVNQSFFGQHSYEKTVTKVTIGANEQKANNTKIFLSGRITNASNGEPVVGATIVVPGENIGAISDGEGAYTLPLLSGRTYNLQLSCLGMESKQYLADIRGPGYLNIEMSSKLIDVREVVVKSGKNHNVRGMQMGFQKIGAKEIKSIPVVMGERDIFKVATLMPGVQTVGEGSAGFNVRGSASDQNLFLLNDIPVLNTGHMFGFFSAFNPDMVSDFNMYKSNFPVEFGGRLASVFEISTRKGNKKEFGARGSISPITASLLVETPIQKDKSSFIISTRSTYSDWILDRLDDAEIAGREANFYDIMSGLHFVGKNNSSTQIFGYYSKDRFNLSTTNSYRYENLGASINYDRPLAGKWTLHSAAVLSNYKNYNSNSIQESRGYQHEFQVQSKEVKFDISGFPYVGHKVNIGANAILHSLNQGVLQPFDERSLMLPVDFGNESGLEYAVYASDEINITDHLNFYGGIRYSFFNYLDTTQHYSGPEFRLALNYIFSPDMSIKASYNRMRQYLFMLSNTVSISPTDRWKLTDPFIRPPVSDQFSIGLYRNYNNSSIETSAELYYKTGQNTIEYRDGVDLTFDPDIKSLVLQGDQTAYGIEFFVKRNTGRLNGWISYAYSRSLIQITHTDPSLQINQGMPFPANYDKPHALNLVSNYKISRRLSLSANVVYNSGRPITFPTGYIVINDYSVVNYSLRNEYRIPDYFRADVSVNIEGNLKKRKLAHSSWAFSVYNLTGRRNAYSVYFTNDRGIIKGYKLSIYGEPIFTISYQFKLGNYAVE